jgi:hypothetical protein
VNRFHDRVMVKAINLEVHRVIRWPELGIISARVFLPLPCTHFFSFLS